MRVIALLISFLSLLFADICSDILDNPDRFFSDNSNYVYIQKNTHCIEIARNLESLQTVAFEIRGVNLDCDGSAAISYQKKFQFNILKALLSPEIYKSTLISPEEADAITNKNRDYFRAWSFKSLHNRMKYEEFNSFYQVIVPMLVDYYLLTYDSGSAIYYANRVANEFLNAAVGSAKTFSELSELENLLLDPYFDKNDLISYLYMSDLDISQLTNSFKTSILLNKNIELLETFINSGARINSGHESAIFYSLKNLAILNFLLSKGADVNYANSFGKTALFYAVEFKDEHLVNLLIEKGADTNAKIISNFKKEALSSGAMGYMPFSFCGLNRTSKSLLMHAAKYSNLTIVKILIKNGARIDDVDDNGYGLVDYAAENSDKEVLEYFLSLGLTFRPMMGGYDE
ncbi:MAG: ankyrin repeat domain-containing protein [Campylobacter sp.]|nr:ankyrin repeat domain-containing protein [Campylobacter sp.]